MNESVIPECPGNTGKKTHGREWRSEAISWSVECSRRFRAHTGGTQRSTFHPEHLFSGDCWYVLGTPFILMGTRLGGL